MDTEQANRSIAEFMGETGLTKVSNNKIVPYDKRYNYLWESIMPVVEKIEALGFIFTISDQYCNIQDGKNNASLTGVMYAPTKKEVIFNACVRFIELHISQKEILKKMKMPNEQMSAK